jgi:hypothetical protein
MFVPYSVFKKSVKQDVARFIRRVGGPGKSGAAEGTLCDFPVRRSAEGASPMLHFNNALAGVLYHFDNSRLIRKVVTPFHRIKGMFFPGIVPAPGVVSQGRVNPPLGGYGVGPKGMNL